MKKRIQITSLCAIVLMLAAGCSTTQKTTSDEYHTITRTYWHGIPIYEKSEFNDSVFPTDDTDKMRVMEREMRKSDEKIKRPERGMITP